MTSPRPVRSVFALVTMSSVATLAACSSPTLSVVSAELIEATDQGSVVEFTIDAKNASSDQLPTRYVAYSAQSSGHAFNGERSGEATLRSTGSQLIVVPAAFPGRVAIGDTASIIGTLGYTLPGPLAAEAYDLGFYRPSVGFSGSATVEEPRPKPKPIRTTPVLNRPKEDAKAEEPAPR